jgi:hypothetical protein
MKLKCRRNDQRQSSDDDTHKGRRTRFDVSSASEVSDETVPNTASSSSPERSRTGCCNRAGAKWVQRGAAAELLRQARWVRLLTV